MDRPDCKPLFALMPANRVCKEVPIQDRICTTKDLKALGETRRKINALLDKLALARRLRDF